MRQTLEDSRRDFIRGSSLLLAGAVPAALAHASVHSSPQNNQLRIGLIGCGVRGTAAAIHALAAAGPSGRLVAVADIFEDRLQQAMRTLKSKFPEQVAVDGLQRFVGMTAYERLLATDVDAVILTTAPVFRPIHTAAAIDAGKHVFAEKPIAADAPGVRSFLNSCDEAARKGLVLAVGFQRRHMDSYRETIERVRQGAIGQLKSAATFCQRPLPVEVPRRRGQSELEYQLRNWRLFDWTGGHGIVEELVQNLDVINWLVGEHPIEAQSSDAVDDDSDLYLAPREDPVGTEWGKVVEFTYRSGFHLFSHTSTNGKQYNSRERVTGSLGYCDLKQGKIFDRQSRLIWKSNANRDGYKTEIERFISNIQQSQCSGNNRELAFENEGRYAAESTLTAIMGHMASARLGRMRWGDCFASNEQTMPSQLLEQLSS